jgi:nicotinate-nucleotide adenylyltransferase
MRNRIGLLGGTFNPIHFGHIELGLQVISAFGLDKILYILSAHPPHKDFGRVVDAGLRWKMIQTALKPFPQLEPCDVEMKRENPSWTFQTIGSLRQKYPGDVFYFISGSEGFLKIKTWKNYRDLFSAVFFIVVLRKPSHSRKLKSLLKQENIPLNPVYDPGLEPPCVFVYAYESERLDLSSTIIRKMARKSKSLRGTVPEEVEKIIQEYNLYGY